MENSIKASDLLYDLGMGLDPKSESLILEAMEKYAESKLNFVETRTKVMCSLLSNQKIDNSTSSGEYLLNRANYYTKLLLK